MLDRILLDQDNVITDFDVGACRIHGWSREELDRKRAEKEVWGMEEAMEITADEFWEPIHQAGVSFWESLPALPWMDALVGLVEKSCREWHIVTAPSRCDTSYTGKVRWLKKQFGAAFDRFAITPHKHILAGGNVVLIDDREANIKNFILAGGDGIVFPSAGNRLRHLAANPLEYVSCQLLEH